MSDDTTKGDEMEVTMTGRESKHRVVKLVIPGRAPPEPRSSIDDNPHFKPLGHNNGYHYFLSMHGRQVLVFGLARLSAKTTLVALAPLHWWELEYGDANGFKTAQIDLAVEKLVFAGYAKGVFSFDLVRGRGLWIDDARVVLHAGDMLEVDGERIDPLRFGSRYLYEAGPALDLGDARISVSEAGLWLELCRSLAWDVPGHATLLAGWCVTALVGGCLPWRPHVFLTGPAGCGKTWVLEHLQRLLGAMAVVAKGGSTEAGLRQRLHADSLAVVMDEAEADGRRAGEAMEKIIALMRQASSDFEGQVFKGGQDGQATAYSIRSSFMLSAIRVPLEQSADESRVSVLSLRARSVVSRTSPELSAMVSSPDYCAGFRRRAVEMIPAILESAKVFALLASERLGSARAGDQIGTLLAGAWALESDAPASREDAEVYFEKGEWLAGEDMIPDSDEEKCLQAILEATIAVYGERGRYEVGVGEALAIASHKLTSTDVAPKDCRDALRRSGIIADDRQAVISNTHRGVRHLLEDTPWAVGWARLLKRAPKAMVEDKLYSFNGSRARGVIFGIDRILGWRYT